MNTTTHTKTIKRIVRLMRKENETFKSITAHLNKMKVLTVRGKQWTPSNLYRTYMQANN